MYEPDENNYNECKKMEEKYDNISVRPYGISDICEKMNFENNKKSGSKFSDNGQVTIEVRTLDKDINEKISFFKADVEGHEIQVLRGAKNHILTDSPKIAICVYHYLSDIWELPMHILSVNKGYKLYLRHYSNGCSETVLYAVPAQ